ncbi:MAG: hypothetical protein ABSE62_05210 [Chthoniobacteraceae bacterium]|jgi:hypothetical protein
MNRTVPQAGFLALSASIAGLLCLAAHADSAHPLPTPFPAARYQRMSIRSPFAVATAAAPVGAPAPGFASQLYVDGVAVIGEKDYVAIKSRDTDKPAIFLEVGESTQDGMKVESIRWSDQTGRSTVDVSKNGEKATLEFDETTIQKDATAVAAPPMYRNGGRMRRLFRAPPSFIMKDGQLIRVEGPLEEPPP